MSTGDWEQDEPDECGSSGGGVGAQVAASNSKKRVRDPRGPAAPAAATVSGYKKFTSAEEVDLKKAMGGKDNVRWAQLAKDFRKDGNRPLRQRPD